MFEKRKLIKKERRNIAKRVRNCFKIDFEIHQFTPAYKNTVEVDGKDVLEVNGETRFYRECDVNKAIERLNVLLRRLSE